MMFQRGVGHSLLLFRPVFQDFCGLPQDRIPRLGHLNEILRKPRRFRGFFGLITGGEEDLGRCMITDETSCLRAQTVGIRSVQTQKLDLGLPWAFPHQGDFRARQLRHPRATTWKIRGHKFAGMLCKARLEKTFRDADAQGGAYHVRGDQMIAQRVAQECHVIGMTCDLLHERRRYASSTGRIEIRAKPVKLRHSLCKGAGCTQCAR